MIAAKHMQSSEKNRMKLIKSTGSTWMAEGMTDAWLQKAGGLKNMNKQAFIKWTDKQNIEVIGNIYENPLLEEQHE